MFPFFGLFLKTSFNRLQKALYEALVYFYVYLGLANLAYVEMIWEAKCNLVPNLFLEMIEILTLN